MKMLKTVSIVTLIFEIEDIIYLFYISLLKYFGRSSSITCTFSHSLCYVGQGIILSQISYCLADSIENLPKLVEDIFQTSINTGPRGAIRLAQGIQAVVGVGSEWLTDASKATTVSDY